MEIIFRIAPTVPLDPLPPCPLLRPEPDCSPPMISADHLDQVGPGFFAWHLYDPKVKADLFSTALFTPSGGFLVDPVPLGRTALGQLKAAGKIKGVIITNNNHLRACTQFAEHFSVPIFAHPGSFPEEGARFTAITDGVNICESLKVIALDGAVSGEIALQSTADAGALIMGDALIHFEPYGFTFLPPKYCLNQKKMRRSLRKLLNRDFERLFFAHGFPILSKANARLRNLLEADS
jgi:glyoxylase-like metal-dependent hydrolase (beta-lactamase superfamily II)